MKIKSTFVFLLILFSIGLPAFAQEAGNNKTEETYQPNIRGSLLVSLGVNTFTGTVPAAFQINPWRSKSVNIYYLYSIPLGNSRFSFNPGFGLGLEKYQFSEGTIPSYRSASQVPGFDSQSPILIMAPVMEEIGTPTYSKNRLAANYFDVPLEFSFASNKSNPKGGLKLALGGKVGILFDAHTKLKYEANGESQKEKHQRQWGLNQFRYSTHFRVGFGGFNAYIEYQLSPMFDNEFDGPLLRTGTNNTEGLPLYEQFPGVTNLRMGIAINLF